MKTAANYPRKLTYLSIEREIGDVNAARTLKNGWRHPRDVAIVREESLGVVFHLEFSHGSEIMN